MGSILSYKNYVTKETRDPFDSTLKESEQQINMLLKITDSMAEMFNIAKEKSNSEIRLITFQKKVLELKNEDLEKKCNHMERMLKECIPMHTILFLVLNAIVIAASTVLLILYYAMQVYVIDAYYVICGLIISVTLFFTALTSLLEWRKMLNG